MVSLYSTVILAIVRLIVVMTDDNSWLRPSGYSLRSTWTISLALMLALIVGLSPLIGFGRYDVDMVGIR